jgi:hypothetical protein
LLAAAEEQETLGVPATSLGCGRVPRPQPGRPEEAA